MYNVIQEKNDHWSSLYWIGKIQLEPKYIVSQNTLFISYVL